MDNNNTVLDKQKLLDYIYNEYTEINKSNNNKVNISEIYEKISNYIQNLNEQENVKNINNNDDLTTLKKNIISDLNKAGKELENLEEIMFKATLLFSLITSIDFSKNDIYKKLNDFNNKTKDKAEFLESCFKKKDGIPTKELKNYVACELLIYKFLCGLKENIIKLKKPVNVKIFNFNNQGISISVKDIPSNFKPKWLLTILERLAQKKPDIIKKCFQQCPKNGVLEYDGNINVEAYSVNSKYQCNKFDFNIKIKDIILEQEYNPIWPLILKKIITDKINTMFKNPDDESNEFLKRFCKIIVLKTLGGDDDDLVQESNFFIERDSNVDFKEKTKKNLEYVNKNLKKANKHKGIIVCQDLNFPEGYPILKNVDVDAYLFTYVRINNKEGKEQINNPCTYKYEFTVMNPLV